MVAWRRVEGHAGQLGRGDGAGETTIRSPCRLRSPSITAEASGVVMVTSTSVAPPATRLERITAPRR